MAREIEEIKTGLESDLMNNDDAAEVFGFNVGDGFSTHFSKVSIESILLHIFASETAVVENNFDEFKAYVEYMIETMRTPRLKWYRDKLLDFMKGVPLLVDTDLFDTTGMRESDIEAAKVIKHAIAIENDDRSVITMKIKGENGPVDEETEEQILAYIEEFRPAGVKTVLINTEGDIFNCIVNIYHDPLQLTEDVREGCRVAIINYIENLPFNGEYSNMELINRLQKVNGVRIADFIEATYQPKNEPLPLTVVSRCKPEAGWFRAGDSITINISVYE